ncbi:MAG: ferritin family protein [Gammaproteobacteria bacterium]|nr:ferritin family protein [Gammaproteobacteria bacterium]
MNADEDTPQGTDYTVAELLAHSLAIEAEAEERYTMLAEQMEVHNNDEVAQLFRRLAEIEGKHIAKVKAMSGIEPIPHIAPWDLRWQGKNSPEAPEFEDVHYLMTPHHALELALQGECYAAEFFADVAASARDETVRQMAAELAEEEREHVALVEKWLARYPKPRRDWAQDHDPPGQE